MKRLTGEQVEARKEKAARFSDNVLGDPDRADEIQDDSLESYAERNGIEIHKSAQQEKYRGTNQNESRPRS